MFVFISVVCSVYLHIISVGLTSVRHECVYKFQAGGRHSSFHSQSSFGCLKGLFGRVSRLPKPFPMEQTDSPVNKCPSFSGATISSSSRQQDIRYEAQSPDEAALVHAAKAYGFTLMERTPDRVTIRLPGGTLVKFDVLDVLSFDSTRRRMSIIVRRPDNKEIIMYTKGADSGIMERLQTSFKGEKLSWIL